MAGEVKQAGVAQLCEDLCAGYFVPVNQHRVVEEGGYFGAFLIGAGQYGQRGIGCARGYNDECCALRRKASERGPGAGLVGHFPGRR